jgi:hypothetical protein
MSTRSCQFSEKVIDPEKADQFRMPNHTVVLRVGDKRWELHPGDSVEIPGGRLAYDACAHGWAITFSIGLSRGFWPPASRRLAPQDAFRSALRETLDS